LTNHAEEKGNSRYLKEYEKSKKRGDAEKDLKEEVHNIIYDNSSMVNTKIKKVEKLVRSIKKESEEESQESEDSEDCDDGEDEINSECSSNSD
jgi:hypothetical protein